jgi:hypothetical protein
MLDVKSINKGILIPRMALEGIDDVGTVPDRPASMLIYNTATTTRGSNSVFPGYYYWNGTLWIRITSNDNSSFSAWLLGGNSGTSPSTHFFGTKDNNSLLFKVNNQKAGYIGVETNDANVFWGYQSGNNNTGYSNVGIGVKALYSNTSITNLVAVGDSSLFSNTTGTGNTAFGSKSLYSNTTGLYNTANGYHALYRNSAGSENTANGYNALYSNTTGWQNTANGYLALYGNTTGGANTANGDLALYSNSTGYENTANGYYALYGNTTGSGNTANGYYALNSNSIGYANTANGYGALSNNTTGYHNTALGSYANVPFGSSLDNATAIGYNAIVDASNKVRIGNGAVTVIEGQVGFTTPSDGRFKFNIREDVSGLDFIMKLRPITYQFDVKRFDENLRASISSKENNSAMEASYNEASAIRRTGFIAQEVEKAAMASGYDFSGIIKPKSEKEHYGLSYESFVVPLVKAVQEQQQMINDQNKKIEQQNEQLAELKKLVEKLSDK